MKTKLVMLLAVLGLLGIVVGCGNTEKATEKKVEKEKSEDVFANGDSFKMRDSDNLSYYFEITSIEPNVLTVYDLENSRREYRLAYTAEKQENGHLVYTFDGEQMNGKYMFTKDNVGGFTLDPRYYITKNENSYFFIHVINENDINEQITDSDKDIEDIAENDPEILSYFQMDKI